MEEEQKRAINNRKIIRIVSIFLITILIITILLIINYNKNNETDVKEKEVFYAETILDENEKFVFDYNIPEDKTNILYDGIKFNETLKELSSGEKSKSINTDYDIEAIYFYAGKNLPNGYNSVKELELLPNSVISNNMKIIAYKDNNKIYIYSNKKIYANEDCSNMFSGFYSLKVLNIELLDTTNVKNMSSMFNNLTNLKFIDFKNFKTDNVLDMSKMFSGFGDSIKDNVSLDLSNFNTTNVTNMENMFSFFARKAKNINLNLDKLDTKSAINMDMMFNNFGSNAENYNEEISINSYIPSTQLMFQNALKNSNNSRIIINYTSDNEKRVDELISKNSKIIKGLLNEK